MSALVFPDLPGLAWSLIRTPEFSTATKKSVSGKEQRVAYYSLPIWHYQLTYEFLRADATQELQTLQAFFCSMYGSFDTFLYNDKSDNSVTNQSIGVGNGSTTTYQLIRTTSAGGFSFTEPIYDVNVLTNVKVSGVTKTLGVDYTVSATGLITFAVAPSVSAPITWTGTFYRRLRFENDLLDFENFMYNLWSLKKVNLVSVK